MTDPIFIKLVLKNVIKLAKGSLNNISQDSFNKILSQQLTHDRSYISVEKRLSQLLAPACGAFVRLLFLVTIRQVLSFEKLPLGDLVRNLFAEF